MKTFQIRVNNEADEELVAKLLESLAAKGIIEFEYEHSRGDYKKTAPASEEQVQEIIDEAELGPYYSEEEAKNILKL